MSRQIHPGLFGEQSDVTQSVSSFEPLGLFEHSQPSLKLDEIEERLRTMRFEIEQFVKSSTLRNEKIAQKLQLHENKISELIKDANEKFAYLAGKLKEMHKSEMKVEALLERHNQIIHNFESRLSQSQRIIENQGLQLIKQTEIIDDARRQIEKLKRL